MDEKQFEALEWLNKKVLVDNSLLGEEELWEEEERTLYLGQELSNKDSIELIKKFYQLGALKVMVEERSDDNLTTDTIFVTVNPKQISKDLLKYIHELEPDEFDEVKENVFRLWWD